VVLGAGEEVFGHGGVGGRQRAGGDHVVYRGGGGVGSGLFGPETTAIIR
jgi:hypothetical protein